MISKLHYITHLKGSSQDYIKLINELKSGGIDWIQLRIKDTDDLTFLEIAQEVSTHCQKTGIKLIINDRVDIAKEVAAAGVHLGKNDMTPSKARKILGPDKIIGGTANTFEDIEYLVSQDVDYIGLGPYQFTNTKKELSPVLGIKGYEEITNQCKKSGITTPIIAIGGIQVSDVPRLLQAGVYGIAVSAALQNRTDALDFRSALKLNSTLIAS